jgi:hypothetical protein
MLPGCPYYTLAPQTNDQIMQHSNEIVNTQENDYSEVIASLMITLD